MSTCLFIFGITSVDTHYTLSHLGIRVDAILVLVVVEGIVSIRDALTATVQYYFCIGPDSELRFYFVATTVLFDLRVFFTVLKIHKTQLALPKWENVGNIFKYGLLLIDFLF